MASKKKRCLDALMALIFIALLVFAGHGAYTEICESIEKDRVGKLESDQRHKEALESLDEIGRDMESMAATTKQLLEKDIEHLEREVERLEKKNQALKTVLEALEGPEASK